MGFSTRYFIFEEDGTLRLISQRLMDDLTVNRNSIPQYAGQKLRMLALHLETENGKPVEVLSYTASFLRPDENGQAQRNMALSAFQARRTWFALEDAAEASSGNVVDMTAKRKRQAWERENRWKPTDREITRAINSIWPDTAGGDAVRAKPIRGAKRRLPLNYEVKEALRKISSEIFNIHLSCRGMSVKNLETLASAIRDNLEREDPDDRPIREGIAASIDHQIAARKAWKRKTGTWITVLEFSQMTDQPDVMDARVLEFERFNGREAAEKAGREMMRKHIDYITYDTEFRVVIFPEAAWNPTEYPDPKA